MNRPIHLEELAVPATTSPGIWIPLIHSSYYESGDMDSATGGSLEDLVKTFIQHIEKKKGIPPPDDIYSDEPSKEELARIRDSMAEIQVGPMLSPVVELHGSTVVVRVSTRWRVCVQDRETRRPSSGSKNDGAGVEAH